MTPAIPFILAMSFRRGAKYWRLFLLTLCLLASSTAWSHPLFDSDDVLELELEGPLSTLIQDKEDKTEYSFTLRYRGEEQTILLRARGKSRIRICEFPPLRMKFSEDQSEGSDFDGLYKVRLVTHCRGETRGEKNAVEEYAAYRIFNLLSDFSYPVRLARIRYIDSDGSPGNQSITRFAFLIEPREFLAARTGGSFPDLGGVVLSRQNQEQAALVYIYQYLIGNTDWSLVTSIGEEVCCHNIDMLEIDSRLFPVPYDFDLAGLVNASYAKPDPTLRLRNVRQRRYRGYCTDPDALRFALQRIAALEEEIAGVILGLPLLSEDEKDKQIGYLDKVFRKAEKEQKTLRTLEKSCLQ